MFTSKRFLTADQKMYNIFNRTTNFEILKTFSNSFNFDYFKCVRPV